MTVAFSQFTYDRSDHRALRANVLKIALKGTVDLNSSEDSP